MASWMILLQEPGSVYKPRYLGRFAGGPPRRFATEAEAREVIESAKANGSTKLYRIVRARVDGAA